MYTYTFKWNKASQAKRCRKSKAVSCHYYALSVWPTVGITSPEDRCWETGQRFLITLRVLSVCLCVCSGCFSIAHTLLLHPYHILYTHRHRMRESLSPLCCFVLSAISLHKRRDEDKHAHSTHKTNAKRLSSPWCSSFKFLKLAAKGERCMYIWY